MLLCGTLVFTACEDDNDSNPTLVQPSEFSLFQPSVGKANVDLERSSSIQLSWTIPTFTDYGAPVVPTYIVQCSPTGQFTKEYDREQKDNTGADFITLEQTFNGTTGDISTEAINQAMQMMLGWSSAADVPAVLPLTFRAIASIRDASFRDYCAITSSNTVVVNTIPYYILNVPPVLWYMVGNNIGTAAWSNAADGVGQGLIPLLPNAKEEYDNTTGTGTIYYTGFMTAGTQFKLILTPGSWDDQLNYTNVDSPDAALISDADGDNHNIGIKADGYYTISVNTKSLKVYVSSYTGSHTLFNAMSMPGGYNNWSMDDHMTACETFSGENHLWMAQFAPTEDGEVKFAANDGWEYNWGSDTFPYGIGVGGGANIPYTAGSYTVFLNDITGQYYFIANPTEE